MTSSQQTSWRRSGQQPAQPHTDSTHKGASCAAPLAGASHVAVVQRQAAEENEEVEAPHHLAEAADAEIGGAIVIREIACGKDGGKRGRRGSGGCRERQRRKQCVAQARKSSPPIPPPSQHPLPRPSQRTIALSAHAPVPAQRTKASHPHVGSDEDADGVVNLLGVEVVVEQEQDLRPAG